MRIIGLALTIVGVIGAMMALGMNVSVETAYGSVNNIGLMNERQNYLIVAGFVVVIGVVLFVAGQMMAQAAPKPAEEGDDGDSVIVPVLLPGGPGPDATITDDDLRRQEADASEFQRFVAKLG